MVVPRMLFQLPCRTAPAISVGASEAPAVVPAPVPLAKLIPTYGCGAEGCAGPTVIVASWLGTSVPFTLTIARYFFPLSPAVSTGVTYVGRFAPGMSTPLTCHW